MLPSHWAAKVIGPCLKGWASYSQEAREQGKEEESVVRSSSLIAALKTNIVP